MSGRLPVIGRGQPWPVPGAAEAITNISRSLGLLPGTDGATVHRAVLRLIDEAEQPRTPEAPDDVLTVNDAAKLLKLSEQHVRRLAETGELPAAKLGDRWRFSRSALLHHLAPNNNGASIATETSTQARH